MRIFFNIKKLETTVIITSLLGAFSIGCGNSSTSPPASSGNKPETVSSNTNATVSSNTNAAAASNTNKAADTPAQPEVAKTWIDVPALANKTAAEIEKTLGQPIRTVPVTEPPQEVPGEYRNYDLAGMKDALSVRFYKGRAVAFTINVPKGKELKTPEELGKLAGFDLAGKSPAKTTDFVSQWNGRFGQTSFAEVTIGKTMKSDYNLVRARTQQ